MAVLFELNLICTVHVEHFIKSQHLWKSIIVLFVPLSAIVVFPTLYVIHENYMS